MPWMSLNTTNLSPPDTKPMAIPVTGADIGTPASINARVLPQTLPIEVEPLDSRISETRR